MTPLIAAVDWLNISINLLLVIHVIICLLLALVVLMQRPKQEGLGAAFGSGLTDQAFGARTTDVLQKGTVYLGTLFFVVTIVLAILIGKRQSTIPTVTADEPETTEEAATPAPVIPPVDAPVVMPDADKKEVPADQPSEKKEEASDVTPAESDKKEDEKPADEPAESTPETPAEPTEPANQ